MPIGIVGALEEEVRPLVQPVENLRESKWAKQAVYEGVLRDREVVLATCGVGKVKAAACTQRLIDRFSPEAVVCTGVAGAVSPRIGRGDIVIGERALQHDFDLGAPDLLSKLRKRWLKADRRLVGLAVEAGKTLGFEDRIHVGSVLTGDQAIASEEKRQWLWETFGGDCVDMESGAVAQVCQFNRIPFLIVRAISDAAVEDSVDEFKRSLVTSAVDAAGVVLGVLDRVTTS